MTVFRSVCELPAIAQLDIASQRLKACVRSRTGDEERRQALAQNRSVWRTIAVEAATAGHSCRGDVRAAVLSMASYVERNTEAARWSTDVLRSFVEMNEALLNDDAGASADPKQFDQERIAIN